MNQKAEFKNTNMIIAILTIGLFFGIFGAWISNNDYYNNAGFNEDSVNDFNNIQNLSVILQDVTDDVDSVTVDSGWFDYFSGMFSKLLRPVKFVYRTFTYVIDMAQIVTSTFNLLPIFREYLTAIIITLVIVKAVLYKMHLGKQG